MSISAVKGVVHFTLGDHFILAYTQNNNKKHKTNCRYAIMTPTPKYATRLTFLCVVGLLFLTYHDK